MLLFDFYERAIRSIHLQMREANLPASYLQPVFFSLKEIKGLRTLIEDYYLIMEQHVLSYILQFFQAKYMLVCQTYVTPYLMKSWSVSFGDFHPSGRIGKQL